MAHAFSYSHVGKVETEQPGIWRHMIDCTITLAADAYSRTTRIEVDFGAYLALVSHAVPFSGAPVSNAGMVPVLASISGAVVTIGLLESGPDAQGPLREKAEEACELLVLHVLAFGY